MSSFLPFVSLLRRQFLLSISSALRIWRFFLESFIGGDKAGCCCLGSSCFPLVFYCCKREFGSEELGGGRARLTVKVTHIIPRALSMNEPQS